jgi:hypothetical protein
MKPFRSTLLLALVVPSIAAAAKPYEVVRPGDSEMSCEQLTAEINTLNEAVRTAQQEQAQRENRNRMAKGVLGGLASAAPLLGGKLGGGLVTQYALSGALQGIQGAAAGPATAAPAAAPPEQQRLDHISEVFRNRPC